MYHRPRTYEPMNDSALPNRLRAGSLGLGEASLDEIETRAKELALIDGRETVTDADFARATVELGGSSASAAHAPEVIDSAMESLTTWDEPTGQHGMQVEPSHAEDEVSVGDQLIQEGVIEADHDSRVTAAEEASKGD